MLSVQQARARALVPAPISRKIVTVPAGGPKTCGRRQCAHAKGETYEGAVNGQNRQLGENAHKLRQKRLAHESDHGYRAGLPTACTYLIALLPIPGLYAACLPACLPTNLCGLPHTGAKCRPARVALPARLLAGIASHLMLSQC